MPKTQPPLNLDDPNTWRGVDKNCLAARLRKIPRYDRVKDPLGFLKKTGGIYPVDRCIRCGSRYVITENSISAFCAACDQAMEIGDGSRCILNKNLETIIGQKARLSEPTSKPIKGALDNFTSASDL